MSSDSYDRVLSIEETETDSDSTGNTNTIVFTTSRSDNRRPWFGFTFNLFCFAMYLYSLLFMNFDPQCSLFHKVLEPSIQRYGLWVFLTFQSLLIQIISSGLHLLAFYFPKYRSLRDIVFTCFAQPIGAVVVYTFWIVWSTQGKDMIYPRHVESFYPAWLNHVTHTMIVPINIAQTYLTFHRYIQRGCYITISYVLAYGALLIYIRAQTGIYVYPYINEMNFISVIIYCGTNLFCTFALYEAGFFMTGIFHLRRLRRLAE